MARGHAESATWEFSAVQIKISTRHGQLSEANQEKIRAKVEKLSRYFERLTSIDVTIDLEHKDGPLVDLQVSAEHKHDFVARDQAADLMAAVDAALHKLEPQLKKYKERVQEHFRVAGNRIEQAAGPETSAEI
jgi:putative sigma-54 modulation protein